MKNGIIFLFTFLSCSFATAQDYQRDPLAHTFSIVARDSLTGEMGVAVQSKYFSVGPTVAWGEAGVGVVATQSFVRREYGPDGLKLLKEGKTAEQVVKILTEADSGRNVRQIGVIGMKDHAASFTGIKCIPFAGGFAEKDFAVQANLMLNDEVWPAMAKAFKETKGPLAERMISALQAGQDAGGDVRGQQSAAILIVNPVATGKPWVDRSIDLRVEDHPEPIKELKRLLHIFRAYKHVDAGDVAVERNDMSAAIKEYSKAEAMLPEDVEMKFWRAVTLVNKGQVAEALPLFKTVFAKDNNWTLLVPELRKVEVLICDDATEKKILSVKKR
jgi:uncharacterized Ntn-hydrolase superfamily protein